MTPTISAQNSMNYCALDLEMNQPSGRIIQVGVCIGNPLQRDNEFFRQQWLINPEESLNPDIVALCAITDDDIAQRAVSHAQMASELGALLTKYNCFVNPVTWGGGDSVELLAELRERGIEFQFFGRRWVDVKTFHVMRCLALGRSHSGGLKSVMGQYKLPFIGRAHRADVDAFNTLRLFFKLMERQSTIEAACSVLKGFA